MYRFDRVLIAPHRDQLGSTLSEAAAAANKGCRTRTLHWTGRHTNALLRERDAAPEGFRQWNGEGDRKQRGFGTDTRSAVAVVWWTDPLGRTHYRVTADRVRCKHAGVKNLLCPYKERPPLWLVYPEDLYFRQQRGKLVLFAACRCGASGSPKSLGWMGPCCALCHDRREEGSLTTRFTDSPARRLLVGSQLWTDGAVFTPDGQALVSYDRCGHQVRIWNLKTGEARLPDLGYRHVSSVAISPDGKLLAIGRGAEVQLYDLHENSLRNTLAVGGGWPGILALAFSPDSSDLAIMRDGRVELWDVAAALRPQEIASGLTSHSESRYLALSPNGGPLIVALGRQGLLLWYSAEKSRTIKIPGVESPCAVAFAPDGRTLAVLDYDWDNIRIWDLETEKVRTTVRVNQARDIAISPDGRLLAAAGNDGCVCLFAVAGGRPLAAYGWHTRTINALAFSPDGRWVATASDDGFVKMWPVLGLLSRESENRKKKEPTFRRKSGAHS